MRTIEEGGGHRICFYTDPPHRTGCANFQESKKGKNRIIVLSFQNSTVFYMEIYGDLAVVVIDIVGYVPVTLSSFILILLLFFNLAFGQWCFPI